MLLSGSLAPALRTGALVGMIELREAQSAPRQRQPSAVREPWSASAGVSRAARSTSPTSARAPSNGPRGGELAIVVGATRGQTLGGGRRVGLLSRSRGGSTSNCREFL